MDDSRGAMTATGRRRGRSDSSVVLAWINRSHRISYHPAVGGPTLL